MRKYRNRIMAGFFLAMLVYVALLLVADSHDKLLTNGVIPQLKIYPVGLLIPVTALTVLSWVLRFGEWHYFLGVIGARNNLSLFDSAIIFVTGFVFAVSPGKIAEVLKSVLLKLKNGFPITRSAPVVIAERVVDGIAVLIITFLAVGLAGDSLELGSSRFLIFLSTGLLIAGLIAVQIRPLAYFFLDIAARMPLVKRFHQALVNFYESSREIFVPRHVTPTAVLGVFAYLSDAVAFAIIISGFGLPITWELLLQATFISGVAAAFGALSGVPNGAGVTEVSNTGMLVAMVGAQHPEFTLAAAATAALLQGFFHKWLRVVAGLIVAAMYRNRLFPEAINEAIAEMETERTPKQTAFSSHTP